MSDNNIHEKLYHASEAGDFTRVEQLLKEGAKPDKYLGEYGRTALYRAAQNGHNDIAKILIEAGANVNTQDNVGWTALYWAARNGHNDIVKILIEAGADVNIQESDGWTALSRAAEKGHNDIAKILFIAGANVNKQDIHMMLAQGQYDLVTEVLKKLPKNKKGNKTIVT